MVAIGISFRALLFTWQKIIQYLLCFWEIHKREILNLVIWLGPGRQRLIFQWLNCLCVLSRYGPLLGVYAPLIVFWAGRWCCLKRKHYFIPLLTLKMEVWRDSLLWIELEQFGKLALSPKSSSVSSQGFLKWTKAG